MSKSYAELLAYANELAEYYAPFSSSGEGNYSLTCPVHGGKSLHMTVTDRIVLFCHGCGQDNQAPLLERIKVDGWDITQRAIDYENAKTKKRNNHLSQNIPAHDQSTLDYLKLSLSDGESYHPVTRCYTYKTQTGQIAFYILRADTNKLDKKGKKVKVIKPYSSFRNGLTNTDTWEFLLQATPKPLYNLDTITRDNTKPIIVVEGEKAAEAAKKLLPDYVITTYPLGMGNWKGADWKPLQGREVYLWPDNEEKSIEKFIGIAGAIEPTPKIVFDVPLTDRPINWDLADPLEDGGIPPDVLLKNSFVPKKVTKLAPIEDSAELFEKYNQKIRLLWSGGDTFIYDITKHNPDPGGRLPYLYFSPSKRYEFFPRKVQVTEKRQENEIDYWYESEHKLISYGVIYDPTTEEELVYHNKTLVTNKFTGWEHKPKECDSSLYKPFLDHVYHIMDKTSADYLMSFIAQMVQDPKTKPGVMPILIGKTLHGKTIIGATVRAILGSTNVWITDGKTFNQKWTGNCSGKIHIFIDEFTKKNLNEDWLNTLITDKTVSFEQKNEKIWTEDSYHRMIAATNIGDFKLSSDDRRWFPIRVYNKSIDSHNRNNPKNDLYYKDIKKVLLNEEALCGLHWFFKTYKIETNVFSPPISEYRSDKMEHSNVTEQIILEICENNSLPDKFGKVLYEDIDPLYPKYVLTNFMYEMAKDHYGYNGSNNAFTKDMNRFIADTEKSKTRRQKYYHSGSSLDRSVEGRGSAFELPPLKELRRRYNEIVDPNKEWPDNEPEPPKESPL